MKKIIINTSVLVIILLDWAALHDILKGEPNPYGEYLVLIISILAFFYVGLKSLRKKI